MSRAASIAIAGVLVLGAVFSVAAVAVAAKNSDPFEFGNPSFCDSAKPARDFGLSSLPPVHSAVNIYGGWSRVMSRPEEFGYGFSEEAYEGPVGVGWTVTAQLWKVDSDGRAVEEVGHTGRFLKVIDAAHQTHIGLTPDIAPGKYRILKPVTHSAPDRRHGAVVLKAPFTVLPPSR